MHLVLILASEREQCPFYQLSSVGGGAGLVPESGWLTVISCNQSIYKKLPTRLWFTIAIQTTLHNVWEVSYVLVRIYGLR